jgi:hypothetical protein
LAGSHPLVPAKALAYLQMEGRRSAHNNGKANRAVVGKRDDHVRADLRAGD